MVSDPTPASMYEHAYRAKHEWIKGEEQRLKSRRDAAMGFLVVALLAASTTLGAIPGNWDEAKSSNGLAWVGLVLVVVGVVAAFAGAARTTQGIDGFVTPNPKNYLQYSSLEDLHRESVVGYDPDHLSRLVTKRCRGLLWSQVGALVVILGAVLIWANYVRA